MRYRLTCLTPLLVGDGRKLSPIDYMVWKDHVNVLDQWRIFRLLAKGPRLESYLAQLKRADKLDFASWGGFAQNFAGRRIPFENAAYSAYWNRATGEALHIPTFACGASGPYLPGAAIKGALRAAAAGRNRGGAGARPLGFEPHALRERRRFRAHRPSAVQGVPAAHLHAPAARRQLCARLEAEPARRGRRRAPRGQRAGLRRDGRSRRVV
jgi:hypothetical protein